MRRENLTGTNIGTDTGTNTGTNTVTYTSTANTKTKVITTAHLKNGKYLEVIPQKKKVIKLFFDYPEMFLTNVNFGKKYIKKIVPCACLRNMMGQTYPICLYWH